MSDTFSGIGKPVPGAGDKDGGGAAALDAYLDELTGVVRHASRESDLEVGSHAHLVRALARLDDDPRIGPFETRDLRGQLEELLDKTGFGEVREAASARWPSPGHWEDATRAGLMAVDTALGRVREQLAPRAGATPRM